MDTVKDPTTGRFYKLEAVFCGKERCKKCAKGEGHGPYWYCYWWEGGKTRKKYIGKTLPASLTQDREESYVRDEDAPLPKTDDLHKTSSLTQDEPLPKTPLPKTPLPKTPLPKTEEGEVVARALEAIRDFHSRGIEPSVSEVAEVVGAPPKHLGRWVKDAAGLEAQNIRRPGKKRARRYLIPTK
jgi:hypothetical protein